MKNSICAKMTALLLIFAMLFSQFSFNAFAADNYQEFPDIYDISSNTADDNLNDWITTASMTQQGDQVTVNAQVTNNTGIETGVNVIAVAYDETGKMLSYLIESANISTFNELVFDLDISMTTSEFTVKVFTWDKATYLPLSEVITLTNGQIISINTEMLKPMNKSQTSFLLEDKLDNLSGTITGNLDLYSMKLIIAVGNLEIANMSIIPVKNWNVENPPFIVGSNEVTILATTTCGKVFSKKIIIVNKNEKNSTEIVLDENDDDGDGLLNWQEYVYGTDKDNPDTDGDGLTDYEEIFITFTDPLLADSDFNGILDGDEDFDEDGLTNIQECFYGTDPYNADTDGDGLSDYDEIFVYFSDPLLIDSDSDGLPDALEIKYGMDPKNPDTLGDGILDGDRIFTVTATCDDLSDGDTVKPYLKIDLHGKQIESLSIDKVSENDIFLNTDIPGYIGNAFDFNMDGTFSSATLTFEFDPSLLNDPDFVPAVYYWDEDAQFLFEVSDQQNDDTEVSTEVDKSSSVEPDFTSKINEQQIDGNKISVTITHFSKFILLNKRLFDEVWETEIKPPNYESGTGSLPIDISFVIDYSNSMTWNDPNGIRKEVTKQFIDKLNADDRAAVISFIARAYLLTGLTNNKQTLINVVNSIVDDNGYGTYSGTNGSAGLRLALDSLNNTGRLSNKYIIFLTDGEDTTTSYSYSSLIAEAKNNDITIFTIGLGSSVNTSMLINVADGTGGKYYHASSWAELEGIFDRISEEDIKTDTDGDRLPDYFEKLINDGALTLGNGVPLRGLHGEKLSWDNPNNKDSDGDGLMDGEEIMILAIPKIDGTYWVYVMMISNPLLKDSDNDGYSDYDEVKIHKSNPLVSDVRISKLKNPDFVNVENYSSGEHYYGGDQSWFEKEFDQNGGCGVVAGANISAYMASSNSKYNNLYPYYSFNTIGKTTYTNYMTEFLDYIKIRRLRLSSSYGYYVDIPAGVWPMSRFQNGVEKYAKDHSVDLKGVKSNKAFNVKNVTDYIISGLAKDRPVAMLIGLNSKLNNIVYSYLDGRKYSSSFQLHWVTITEIKEDNIAGSTTAKVSSWGCYAYIDIKDYVEGESIYNCVLYFE